MSVTLTYPKVSPTLTLILPNPIYNDVLFQDTQMHFSYSYKKEFFSYIITPIKNKFTFTFNKLRLTKVTDLINFLETSNGNVIGFQDYENNDWTGRLITNPLEITKTNSVDNCGFSTVTLEFRGSKDS